MKLKVVNCVDPRNPSEVKYRLAPFYSYKIDLDGIAENISRSSSVNKSDVLAVIDALEHRTLRSSNQWRNCFVRWFRFVQTFCFEYGSEYS